MGDALEPRKVLVIDIGGTSVKLLVSGQHERRMFPSGPKMMPDKMVRKTLEMVADWSIAGKAPDGKDVKVGGTSAEVVKKTSGGNWVYVIDSPYGTA